MNRDFKGIWIPKELWLCDKLSATEKILISEIDSLDSGCGCWASNKHFADITLKSEGTVANMLSDLKQKGFIECSDHALGNKRMLRVSPLFHEKMNMRSAPIHENVKNTSRNREPIKESNTVENTTTSVQGQALSKAIDKKPINWDNCKSDLQRFMSYYVKHWNKELYKNGTSEQVTGFYKAYGKTFSQMLAVAGSVEIACNALYYLDKHFTENKWSWNIRTVVTNFPEFVNLAMEKAKETK